MTVYTLFPDAAHFNMLGLCISIGVYGWILLTAADMIGDGADSLLEAMPQHGALIGALLVPILGAIPDGMMILLSGMGDGPKEQIQRELNVGVGTLAGSTIMLLTVPFAIAIFVNRRPVVRGRALIMEESKGGEDGMQMTEASKNFERFMAGSAFTRNWWHTEDKRGNLFKLGSSVEKTFPMSAKIMMGSTLTYLIVQVPAFFASKAFVQDCSFVSFVASLVLLAIYCFYSATQQSGEQNLEMAVYRRQARSGRFETERMRASEKNFKAFAKVGKSIEEVFKSLAKGKPGLGKDDVGEAFRSLGLDLGDKSFDSVFCDIDLDKNEIIDLTEFTQFFITYISEFATSSLSLDQVDRERREEEEQNVGSEADPEPEVLNTLNKWLKHELEVRDKSKKSRGQSYVLYLKNLKKHQRKQVHNWCNKKEEELRKINHTFTLQHYSEPYIDAEDFTKPRRRLRIELCVVEHGKTRYDPKLHRWACASGDIQKWCVRTYKNKHFSTFYAKCLEAVGKTPNGKNSKLSEDDVVELSKVWRLPVFISQDDAKEGEKATREKFQDTLHLFHLENRPAVFSEDHFKIFLESMVSTETSFAKAAMHKDFDHTQRSPRNMLGEKSRSRKPTVIYPTAKIDEKTSLRSRRSPNYRSLGSMEEGKGAEEELEQEAEKKDDVEEDSSKSISGPLLWMLWGSILVAVFSDPMVDMIDEFSNRLNINAFYVSFIVTPLVSNASEVLCAAKLAGKLTDKTLTVALSTLYGAAVMNSTFCMAIFAGLVYFRGLEWNYSSEVIIIVIVMYVLGGLGVMAPQQTFSITGAGIALFMFPFSLVFVYVCQNWLGMP